MHNFFILWLYSLKLAELLDYTLAYKMYELFNLYMHLIPPYWYNKDFHENHEKFSLLLGTDT